jgi:hypothetical protein
MILFAAQNGGVVFTIQGTGLPPNGRGDAYAVWLVGGSQPHRLGFAQDLVKADGRFGASGPQQSDQQSFATWFSQARKVVVSRETSTNGTQPGPVVLEGRIPQGKSGSTSGG